MGNIYDEVQAYTATAYGHAFYNGGVIKLSGSNNKSMKESTQTRFPVTFQRTTVEEFSYDVLAESLEDAKKQIEAGDLRNSSKTISVETKIVE